MNDHWDTNGNRRITQAIQPSTHTFPGYDPSAELTWNRISCDVQLTRHQFQPDQYLAISVPHCSGNSPSETAESLATLIAFLSKEEEKLGGGGFIYDSEQCTLEESAVVLRLAPKKPEGATERMQKLARELSPAPLPPRIFEEIGNLLNNMNQSAQSSFQALRKSGVTLRAISKAE